MKKRFNDKRVIFFYIIVIFALILGFTYALGSNSLAFNVDTAIVAVDETAYGDTTFDTSELDFKPILDSAVETSSDNVIKIDFTVGGASENNNDNIIYDIALVDLDVNCNLLSSYIKWKLVKNGEEISTGSLDYKFDTIVNGRLVLTTVQQDLADYSTDQTGYDDYTFYMWFSDSCQSDLSTCISNNQIADQSKLIGQNLSGKIEVELYTESKKALERKPSTTMDSTTCSTGYLVIYNYEGGTGEAESKNVMTGSTYGELTIPTKEGYAFRGWYTEPNGGGVEVTDESIVELTSNQDLYAYWTIANYTISYDANGGSGTMDTQSVTFDTEATIATNAFTRTGYTFLGWTTNSDGTDDGYNWTNWSGTWAFDNGDKGISDNKLTLYARWSINQYNVTYAMYNMFYNFGDASSTAYPGNYSISNKIITITAVSNDGYTYLPYRVYLEANKTYIFSCDTDGTWGYGTEDTVEGFLMLNGELNTYYHMGNRVHTFTPTVTGEYWLRLDVNQSGKTHTFSNVSIAEVVSTSTVTYGSTYGTMPTPTKSGYTFVGWYDDSYKNNPLNYYADAYSDLKSAYGYDEDKLYNHYANYGINEGRRVSQYLSTTTYSRTSDQILYGYMKPNKYTITYNANGGSGAPSSQTKTYGDNLTLSSTKPTRLGYQFLGWSTSSTATSATYAAGGKYSTNAAATLYAVWRTSKVTIKHSVNGGTVTSSTTADDGTVYTWTTDSSGIIYRSVNGGTSAVLTMSIAYGASTNSNGLVNWDNSAYIYITRSQHYVKTGSEWKCLSGCTTSGKVFSDTSVYAASDFCDASYGDCTVVIGVNWVADSTAPVCSITKVTCASETSAGNSAIGKFEVSCNEPIKKWYTTFGYQGLDTSTITKTYTSQSTTTYTYYFRGSNGVYTLSSFDYSFADFAGNRSATKSISSISSSLIESGSNVTMGTGYIKFPTSCPLG